MNTKFHGLRALVVQSEKRLYIGNQFKETHESIIKRFQKTLGQFLPIKVQFEKGLIFPLIASDLSLDNKLVLTDFIFSPENSPFSNRPVETKLKLISSILEKWQWLDKLCAYYKFQESAGQKQDRANLEKLKTNPKYKDMFKNTPLSIGLWVSSGILSQLF